MDREQLNQLLRATAERSNPFSTFAREALAASMAEPIRKTLDKLGTVRNIYQVNVLPPGAESRYPLDLFYDEDERTFRTWAQPKQGGMPVNYVEGIQDVFVPTWDINSAVEWRLKFAREARFDIITRAIHKMVQAIIRKEERDGWAVILGASAAKVGTLGTGTCVRQASSNKLSLEALNAGIVAFERINTSVGGGTPAGGAGTPTDAFMAPERLADVRSWTYNAINQANGTTTNGQNTQLDDVTKREIYTNAGLSAIWGITLHPMREFGKGKDYNTMYGAGFTASSTTITPSTYADATVTFSATNDDLVILLDLSAIGREAFVMPVKQELETYDDPVAVRAGRQRVAGTEELGFAILDDRRVGSIVLDSN